jgi:elongation factor Ts
MSKINMDLIRKLRGETGAPVIRVKKVLEEVDGNEKKATEILKKEGFEKVAKREGRATSQGLIEAYVHHSGKICGVVELLCETDFVARNELFKALAHDLAMQVASMNPKNIEDLLKQEFIKDPSKKISDLVKEVIVKTGENVRVGRVFRVELGK